MNLISEERARLSPRLVDMDRGVLLNQIDVASQFLLTLPDYQIGPYQDKNGDGIADDVESLIKEACVFMIIHSLDGTMDRTSLSDVRLLLQNYKRPGRAPMVC